MKRVFHRIKSPPNNAGISIPSPVRNNLQPQHPNDRLVETPGTTTTTTVGGDEASLPTNVQVVARIRPVTIKSNANELFFHTAAATPSRRRRLIGLKHKKKDKDSQQPPLQLDDSTTTTTTTSTSDTFVAWDVIDGDTARQSDKTEQVKGRTHSFTLDKVFGTTSSTQQIYDVSVKSLVVSAMQGYHSTVLAYGQTSTGKTHTMSGTKSDPGLVPLAVQECFRLVKDGTLDESQSSPREYLFRVSYLEVYKEHIRDLLCTSNNQPIRLFDGPNGLLIRGLKEEVVTTPEQVFDILRKGEKRRAVGATNMNQHSSRSHAMVRIWIESSTTGGDNKSTTRVSSLSLVDLAGSESVRLNGTDRREEGQYINKSLMTLGQVVLSLSDATAAGDGKKKRALIYPTATAN